MKPGVLAGYLEAGRLPDSLRLLPPPPTADSAAFALDSTVQRRVASLRGGPRWSLATGDADLSFPHVVGVFDCALGLNVDQTRTPKLYRLLQRTMVDAGMSTSAAKHRYQRPRPFVALAESTCLPRDEAQLRGDGSYPSGHSALGWAAALVLAEAAPERAEAVLMRGRSYGESRLVCNAHWHSDVLEGRFMGAATVARLHTMPEFAADLASAKRELAMARARREPPPGVCAAEAAALRLPARGVF